MRVTRREILLGLGALGVVRPQVADAAARSLMSAADVHVDGYPTVAAVRWIGTKLERETGGRLSIRIYHAGQLGRESDTVDLARFGALDFTRVNFGVLNNPFPLTRVFALPYVFDSVGHMRRAVDSAVGRAVLEGFRTRDLIGLAIYDSGPRSFYNVRRPVHEPADLAGLKVRVPPSDIFIQLARALGANPTPLPYGEVYSALQTHLIDGAENNWRTFHTTRQFEVARYWSNSEHSYAPDALLMSKRTFDALSKRDRDLVMQAASESVPFMRAQWDREQARSREHVIAAGVSVNDVNVEAFRRAAAPVLDKYLKTEGLGDLHRSIRGLA
jgi:tripartite ATP-independent transporter DctP family solute receptor